MAIATEDRTPSMEAQFPATPEATEGQGELKPCPFCGMQPTESEFECNDDGDTRFVVACNCQNSPADEPTSERYVQAFGESPAEAASAWNTRARSAHADIEAGGRDYWLHYDHQTGQWLVESEPPKVIRTGAEVIHTREVSQLVERNPTEHEEWLTRRATLDRHRVLVLEKRLAESTGLVARLTAERTVIINDPSEIHAANIHRDLAIDRAEAAEARLAASDAAVGALTNAVTASKPIIERLIAAGFNVDTWGLKQRLAAIDAALSQAQPTAPGANSTNKASG